MINAVERPEGSNEKVFCLRLTEFAQTLAYYEDSSLATLVHSEGYVFWLMKQDLTEIG